MTQPNCTCFCPSADVPPPIVIAEGGLAGQVDITIFGTQSFQASILTNPTLPSGAPLIASVAVYGNTLQVVTAFAQPVDGPATYAAVIQVCNACGSVDIPISVQVVEEVPPPTFDCDTVSALFPPAGRPMQPGDTILGRDVGGACVQLQPPVIPPPEITCGVIAALFIPLGRAAGPGDLIFGSSMGQCAAFDPSTVDLCAEIRALTAGFPVDPTTVFIPWAGTDPGSPPTLSCGSISVSDLLSLVPPPPTACEQALAYEDAVGSINFSDRFIGITGSPPTCRLITPQQVLDFIEANIVIPPPPVDVCAAIQAFPLAAPVNTATATIPFIEGGVCLRTTINDLAASLPPPNVCDALANFAFGAPIDPAQTFIPFIENGNCQIGFLSTMLAFAGPSFPLLAPNGSCAQPSYSFTTDITSGMFMFSPGVVRISAQNCLDYIDIGASINLVTGGSARPINVTASGDVAIQAGPGAFSAFSASMVGGAANGGGGPANGGTAVIAGGSVTNASAGVAGFAGVYGGSVFGAVGATAGRAELFGGNHNDAGGVAGLVLIKGGNANSGGAGGEVQIIGGASSGPGVAGAIILVSGGASGGGTPADIIFSTQPSGFAIERMRLQASGALLLAGNAGVAGQAILSQGPGLPPVWGAPSASVRLNEVQDANGNATRSHGTSQIRWQWGGFGALADAALVMEQVGPPSGTGRMFVMELNGDNMRGITVNEDSGFGVTTRFIVGGVGTTVLAAYDSYPGVNVQAGDLLLRGGDVPGAAASGGGNATLRAGNKGTGAGGTLFLNGGESSGSIIIQTGSRNAADLNTPGGDLFLRTGTGGAGGPLGVNGRIEFTIGNPSLPGSIGAGRVDADANWVFGPSGSVKQSLSAQSPFVCIRKFDDGPAAPTGVPLLATANYAPIAFQRDGATLRLWAYDTDSAVWRSVVLT